MISAVVPTVGRPAALRVCMETLCRQTLPVAEVVVVHCGDDAETARVCADPAWARAGVECRYFFVPERNAARQRNFGVEQARGDELLLLDDDVELEAEWSAELVGALRREPAVGAAMGRLVNQPLAAPTFLWRMYRRLLVGEERRFAPGRLVGAGVPNGFPEDATEPIPCEWIGGGVTAIKRAAFLSVGGFAPYFSGSSPGEDLDLGYRLSRHWRVLYVPTARCLHHQDPGGRAGTADYQVQSMRAFYAIQRRAMGRTAAAALTHLLFWIAFQTASEVAALRKQWSARVLTASWARLRGVLSCLTWDLPRVTERPELFPGARA